MKIKEQIDQIISVALPAISTGEETLDSVLEKYPQISAELRPRLEAALWLQQLKNGVTPRPGYIASSRKYLESQIASMRPIGFWQRLFKRYTPQRWVFNITAPIIVILLLALIINSAVLAARLSIPGEPLYSTKLLIEDVRVALTQDPVHKTDLYIQFSRERTTEFVELVLEGDYEYLPSSASRLETQIITSLHSLNDIPAADQAKEQLLVANFRDTLSNEIIVLDVLKTSTPPSALPGIELAINVAQSGLMALR